MKLSFKSVFVPALVLVIICACVTALLGVTNELTKDTIEQAAIEKQENSRKIVLPTAESFEASSDESYYIGKASDGSVVGYVFVTSFAGYSGNVEVMTGIAADSNISGIVILEQTETPGLGANATATTFTDQYKQAVPEGGLEVVKSPEASEGQISALTGATITTDAVTNAVNEAIDLYNNIEKEA